MHESWKPVLQAEFEQPYFKELSDFLHAAYEDDLPAEAAGLFRFHDRFK